MSPKPRIFQFLLLCLATVAVCAIAVHAQSGRKKPTPPPAAPVPTPTPEPSPSPKPQKEPEFGFLLGADRFDTFESYPLAYYDAAMRGCGDRLRSGSSARVDVAQSHINRGEAIKKAKSETNTYVVLLRLRLDPLTARSFDDLELDFVVFAPQTGKVVTSGKTYLNARRTGPVIVGPTSRGSALYREQMLRRAGEDAAERILKAMNLNVPPVK